jgi:hypothetical protein
MRRVGRLLSLTLLLASAFALPAIEIESYVVGFGQAWTGNAHLPENGFDVTGSEAMPIDGFFSFGVRLLLIEDGFISPEGILSMSPRAELGYRRYALFESGRVSPAPVETGVVVEDGVIGPGSADVLTVRLPVSFAYELRFQNQAAFYTTASPTIVLRFPVANMSIRDSETDLLGMYGYFLGGLRFLMPELGLGYRFRMSDFLEVDLALEYGFSLVDLFDSTYSIYDQMRVGISARLGFIPPFGGLFRDRELEQELPPGVEPRDPRE